MLCCTLAIVISQEFCIKRYKSRLVSNAQQQVGRRVSSFKMLKIQNSDNIKCRKYAHYFRLCLAEIAKLANIFAIVIFGICGESGVHQRNV